MQRQKRIPCRNDSRKSKAKSKGMGKSEGLCGAGSARAESDDNEYGRVGEKSCHFWRIYFRPGIMGIGDFSTGVGLDTFWTDRRMAW